MGKRLALLVVVFAMTMTACSKNTNTLTEGGTTGIGHEIVTLRDGRLIDCITYGGLGRGISCDWENAG